MCGMICSVSCSDTFKSSNEGRPAWSCCCTWNVCGTSIEVIQAHTATGSNWRTSNGTQTLSDTYWRLSGSMDTPMSLNPETPFARLMDDFPICWNLNSLYRCNHSVASSEWIHGLFVRKSSITKANPPNCAFTFGLYVIFVRCPERS